MEAQTLPPDPILATIERFMRSRKIAATAFGNRALGDPTLVHELRKGREVRRITRAKILHFINSEKAKARNVPHAPLTSAPPF